MSARTDENAASRRDSEAKFRAARQVVGRVISDATGKVCPASRNARTGRCEAPGCTHFAGSIRRGHAAVHAKRICTCCVRRLGALCAVKYLSHCEQGFGERFLMVEEEMLARLQTLGAR